jgi:hypothetical protein
MRARPMGGPGLPPRPTRLRDASPARKRRGLSIDRTPLGLELFFQFLVFTPQPLPLGLRPPEVLAQLPILTVQPLDVRLRTRGIRLATWWHALVMPDSRAQYKRKPLGLRVSVARDQREGRVSVVLTR